MGKRTTQPRQAAPKKDLATIVREEKQRRATACNEVVQKALAEYNCEILVEVFSPISGGIEKTVVIVAKPL